MRLSIALTLAAIILVAPAAADEEVAKKYTPAELEEIVGPVALYPDTVLASVLPATTVPIDVMKAARWLELVSGEVSAPPENSGWDAAVEALIQFPDVLEWMSENIDWMEQMGYAVSEQQEDVLAAIQAFRKKAKDTGNLESNDKQQVVVEQETQVIQIQPTQPQVIYVPQYNPVYATQPVHTHPPSYAGHFWAGFAAGAVGAWAFHEIRWGGHHHHHWGHYGGGGIYVNNSPTYNFNKNGTINKGTINRTRVGDNTRVGGGNTRVGNKWNPSGNARRQLPSTAPRGRGGKVTQPRSPTWNQRRSGARPPKGGLRAPSRRPSTGVRPRPTPVGTRRPAPSVGGRSGVGLPPGGVQRPGTRTPGRSSIDRPRPDRSPSAGSGRSALGGTKHGSGARRDSQRGRRSLGSGRSRSGGSRARSSGGRSRSIGGGGRSRGGGRSPGGGRLRR
jgi:hypothetical protein